jgi:hypothetical protein
MSADRSERIERLLLDLIQGVFKIMAQIDDLNTAVAALAAQDAVNATDIQNALAKLAAAAPADLQPAISAIQAAVAGVTKSDQSLENFGKFAGSTLTQAVVGGAAPQTVSIAVGTGLVQNEVVVVDGGTPTSESVTATAVSTATPGSITGVFLQNHALGASVV